MTGHVASHACPGCGDIPDRMQVDLLHGNARLPPSVETLVVIGGNGSYSLEQLRRCPACGAYFAWIHDHDSEAGLGEGWTDEVIRRLTRSQALTLAREAAKQARGSARYWRNEAARGDAAAAAYAAHEEADMARLEAELARLGAGN